MIAPRGAFCRMIQAASSFGVAPSARSIALGIFFTISTHTQAIAHGLSRTLNSFLGLVSRRYALLCFGNASNNSVTGTKRTTCCKQCNAVTCIRLLALSIMAADRRTPIYSIPPSRKNLQRMHFKSRIAIHGSPTTRLLTSLKLQDASRVCTVIGFRIIAACRVMYGPSFIKLRVLCWLLKPFALCNHTRV